MGEFRDVPQIGHGGQPFAVGTPDQVLRALEPYRGRQLTHLSLNLHQPWAGRLVHVLPAALHRELRLDRNRYKITEAEQERLLGLTIAVAGLSVGRSVAGTLVREGIGGELRLADFDTLDLSNLNRVPGGVADIGVNKAVLAAREIVELDPYVRVVAHTDGVRPETVDAFLAGVDVVLDECDDLEVKLLLRERARASTTEVSTSFSCLA